MEQFTRMVEQNAWEHWYCPFCSQSYKKGALVSLMLHALTEHPEEPLSGDIANVLFKVALASLQTSDTS